MNQNKDFNDAIDVLGKSFTDKLDALDKISASAQLSVGQRQLLSSMSKNMRKGVATGDIELVLKQAETAAALKRNHGN